MALIEEKGTIEIKLAENELKLFEPGQPIKGKITLHLKKRMNARELRIAFYGLARKSGPRGYTLERIFETKAKVSGSGIYSDNSSYEFSITPPAAILTNSRGLWLRICDYFKPPSLQGYYLHATLDLPRSFDINKRIEVVRSKR